MSSFTKGCALGFFLAWFIGGALAAHYLWGEPWLVTGLAIAVVLLVLVIGWLLSIFYEMAEGGML